MGGVPVLDRVRRRLDSYLGMIGSAFSVLAPSPTAWTIVGLGASVLAGLAFAGAGPGGEFLGGALILVAGWFDVVDGAVARVTGRVSKRGAFLDSTLDRVSEVAVFMGILAGGRANPTAVVLALSASLLVSYTRAKGDALGVSLSGVGVGERSERLLILAISSLAGVLTWGVYLVALVAAFTFLERTFRAASSLT
jgi:archaetidylinositol phosphate synthase